MAHEKDLTISYFDGTLPTFEGSTEAETLQAAFVAAESKGKNPRTAKLVELAVVVLEIERETGKPVKLIEKHNWFQDPEEELSEAYTEITGITEEMVKGNEIPLATFEAIIDSVDIFITYNAGNIRPLLQEQFPNLSDAIFACLRNQIEWTGHGNESRSLTHLTRDHLWYNDSLRAEDLCAVYIKLLTEPGPKDQNYLLELINRAEEPLITVEAKVQMRQKYMMKKERFRWDPKERTFLRCMGSSTLERVRNSLSSRGFRGELIERDRIPATERFK